MVSSAKVEKVVKPPQTPVFRSRSSLGEMEVLDAATTSIPIQNEPMRLISRVCSGNAPVGERAQGKKISGCGADETADADDKTV